MDVLAVIGMYGFQMVWTLTIFSTGYMILMAMNYTLNNLQKISYLMRFLLVA